MPQKESTDVLTFLNHGVSMTFMFNKYSSG